MRVGLYQKFFTWAMLNLVLLGVITALFIGGVLLFNNNLYSSSVSMPSAYAALTRSSFIRSRSSCVSYLVRGAAIQTRKPMGFGP